MHRGLELWTRPAWMLPVERDGHARARRALAAERYEEAWRGGIALIETALAREPEAGVQNGAPAAGVPLVRDAAALVIDALYEDGRFDACHDFCRRAERERLVPPDNPYPDLFRGWIALQTGRVRRAHALAAGCLERLHPGAPSADRSDVLHLRGMCEYRLGRPRAARRTLEEALALSRASSGHFHRSAILNALTSVAAVAFDLGSCAEYVEEGRRLNDRLGRRDKEAQNLVNLGVIRLKRGSLEASRDLLEHAVILEEGHGYAVTRVRLLIARAKVLVLLGRLADARRQARAALPRAVAAGFGREHCLALEVLGDCEFAAGRADAARVRLARALAVCRELGRPPDLEAGLRRRLGELEVRTGRPAAAAADLRRAVRLARRCHERYEHGIAAYLLARCFRLLGRHRRAYRSAREAIAVLRRLGADLELGRAQLEAARVQLAWWEAEGRVWAVGRGGASRAAEAQPAWRASLEIARSYAVEALHGFEDLGWGPGLDAASRLLARMREAEEPGRAHVWRRAKGAGWGMGPSVADQAGGVAPPAGRAGASAREEAIPAGSVFVAESPAMREVAGLIEVAAAGDDPVLITGETGTGKEIVARRIHALGRRRDAPLVAVNCAAIPETLFERELFGHRRGAFTDAGEDRPGLVERAAGGTLFLDEIGDLPAALQTKLLRLLQERVFRRLGEPDERAADLRIVTATNADLAAMIARGRFRADLYYRLRYLELRLPPLRERLEDLEALITLFLLRSLGPGVRAADLVGPETLDTLRRHPWPGNVRELEAAVRRVALLSSRRGPAARGASPVEIGRYLAESVVGAAVRRESGPVAGAGPAGPRSGAGSLAGGGSQQIPAGDGSLAASLEEAERRRITEVLLETDGNRTRAAALLRISRNTLHRKMLKHGIEIPAF